jgi:hypothetical protein
MKMEMEMGDGKGLEFELSWRESSRFGLVKTRCLALTVVCLTAGKWADKWQRLAAAKVQQSTARAPKLETK